MTRITATPASHIATMTGIFAVGAALVELSREGGSITCPPRAFNDLLLAEDAANENGWEIPTEGSPARKTEVLDDGNVRFALKPMEPTSDSLEFSLNGRGRGRGWLGMETMSAQGMGASLWIEARGRNPLVQYDWSGVGAEVEDHAAAALLECLAVAARMGLKPVGQYDITGARKVFLRLMRDDQPTPAEKLGHRPDMAFAVLSSADVAQAIRNAEATARRSTLALVAA
jgi:hypothetical protein